MRFEIFKRAKEQLDSITPRVLALERERLGVEVSSNVQAFDVRPRYSRANVSHSELKPVDYPSYHGSSGSIMRCHARLPPVNAPCSPSVAQPSQSTHVTNYSRPDARCSHVAT